MLSGTCLKPYVGYTAGRGVGFDRGYGSGGLLALYDNSSNYSLFYPFVDARVHILNNGWKAYNVGIGARYLCTSIEKIMGLNIYYDSLQGHKRNFHQSGLGLEFLGQNWDFRANGYIPIGKHQHESEGDFYSYEHGFYKDDKFTPYFLKSTKIHKAAAGADAELGWTIKQFNSFTPWGLYVAAGPYYFSTKEKNKQSAIGGKCRLVVQLFSYLTLEAGFSADRVFHNRYYGRFLLSLPLECTYSCEEIWRKITEIPTRNDMIVTHKYTHWEKNY